MKKIKKFFINLVAGFVPSRAMRGRIRKMLTKGNVVPPPRRHWCRVRGQINWPITAR